MDRFTTECMSAIEDRDYEYIRKLVYQHSRINLGPDKKELVAARLGKRLRQTGISSYSAYCDYLQSPEGEEEMDQLIDVISTNHTFFFRESQHFDFLQQVALPEITKQLNANNGWPLRVWSAASSTGEEPFSIAILLNEFFTLNRGSWEIRATDISTRVLESARKGVYPSDRIKDMKPELLRRYFQKGVGEWDGYFRIKEEFRNRVQFEHINLLQAHYPFQTKFNIIFCRNVMIYFDRPTQEQLIEKLSNQLVHSGYLMIGHSESLTGIQHALRPVKPAIYFKP